MNKILLGACLVLVIALGAVLVNWPQGSEYAAYDRQSHNMAYQPAPSARPYNEGMRQPVAREGIREYRSMSVSSSSPSYMMNRADSHSDKPFVKRSHFDREPLRRDRQYQYGESRHAAMPGAAVGGGFWGHRLEKAPKHFLFGYGSLLNSKSRAATSGKMTAAIPVRLSADFGYVRAWNFQSPTSQITALGLRKIQRGERGSTINGVIYPVDGDSIEQFDVREEGYKRILIERDQIEAVGWQSLPVDGQIWVYVPEGPSGEPGVGLSLADINYPFLQSYIDICVTGALEYGPDFAEEFLETTFGWNVYWLNDRILPRRPWVEQKQYKVVDKLLAKFPADPQRNKFSERRLPVEYPLLAFERNAATR